MTVTIKEIAKEAGVSVATISRVVNKKYLHKISPETQRKVRMIIEKMKYHPSVTAVNLLKKSLKTIGLLIKYHNFLVFSYYFDGIIRGILSEVEQRDYKVILIPVNDNLKNIIRSKLVHGLLLLGTEIDDSVIDTVKSEEINFVVLNNYSEIEKYNFVDCDNITGAKVAVKYLIDKGHRRIGFIGGPKNSRNAEDRFLGYKQALEENSITFEPHLYYQGSFFEEDGLNAVDKFFQNGKNITAIFSSDDTMALGAIKRLKNLNIRVPDDIAVIGFDNSKIAEIIEPPLTTVNQPIFDIGKNSARMLIDMIEGRNVDNSIVLRTELIVRKSA